MLRILLVGLLWASPLVAQEVGSGRPLGECLADNTSGRERKDLARWMFFAISIHPEIRPYAVDSIVVARELVDRLVAVLVTRLIAEDCAAESKAALAGDGPLGIEKGFEVLGGLAMQELMTNEEVSAAIMGFTKYLDQAKLTAVFGEQ